MVGSRGYHLHLLLNLLLARRAVLVLRVLLLRICDMEMLALYKDYTHGLFELGCWIWTWTLDGPIVYRLYPLHENVYNGTNIKVEDKSQLANEKLDVNVSYM